LSPEILFESKWGNKNRKKPANQNAIIIKVECDKLTDHIIKIATTNAVIFATQLMTRNNFSKESQSSNNSSLPSQSHVTTITKATY